MNQNLPTDIFTEAKKFHIEFIRLAPDKWPSQGKDFLIGDADHYNGLVPADLIKLKQVLKEADKNHIKIVITFLSLPGARWKQLNDNRDDARLWMQSNYQTQAIQFWQDLATELKNNPVIVGYNILNEPHPEITSGCMDYAKQNCSDIYQKAAGTSADLNLFYQKIVKAIRQVDPATPIILDAGMYADPRAFIYLKPIHEKNILYAFHMYEPYVYTNKKLNKNRYSYPGYIPLNDVNKNPVFINKEKLKNIYFSPVIAWQKQYHIPSQDILAEEFGVNRTTEGAANYLEDLISLFNQQGWHWAFYAFREYPWDGMNYELGQKPTPWTYWQEIEAGKKPQLPRINNSIWNILKQALKA